MKYMGKKKRKKEKRKEKVKTTSGFTTQNPTNSNVNDDEGGGATRGAYCPRCGDHTPAREIHTQACRAHASAHAVLIVDCKKTVRTWVAGDDGGLACEDRGQHEESRSGFKVNPSMNQRRSRLRNGG